MAKSDRSLLDEIEAGVLSDAPLAETLRKCIALGGRAGSTALRDWATKEARGYGPGDELPEYRKIAAPLFIDGQTLNAVIRGQRIGVHFLPDFAREAIKECVSFTQGVGEIESVVQSAVQSANGSNMIKLSPPGSAEVVAIMNHESDDPYQHIVDLYHQVHVAAVVGLLDGIRTTLTELIAEMRAGTPAGQDLPSGGVADQAVQVAVHGDGNRVTVMHSSDNAKVDASVGGSQPEGSSWWSSLKVLGSLVVGVATVAAAVFAWPGLS